MNTTHQWGAVEADAVAAEGFGLHRSSPQNKPEALDLQAADVHHCNCTDTKARLNQSNQDREATVLPLSTTGILSKATHS